MRLTLADALRERGYATAAVGKWHLGSTVPHLPTRHGFDSYFGISNGDQTFLLLRGGATPVKDPPGLDQITRAYTEEAVSIIRNTPRDRPFFLYLAHRAPHVPLEPASDFRGRSAGGLYGDVVEELDWSVGEIMKAVRERGTAERTIAVFFMSDNGPRLSQGEEAGSPGPFRAGKNSPYEGGVRVPAIAWWPGRYPAARVVSEPVMSLDVFPTVVAMAKGDLSPQRRYYGTDLTPLLAGEVSRLPGAGTDGSREMLGYYFGAAVSLWRRDQLSRRRAPRDGAVTPEKDGWPRGPLRGRAGKPAQERTGPSRPARYASPAPAERSRRGTAAGPAVRRRCGAR